jgi:acetyl esterase/lipase
MKAIRLLTLITALTFSATTYAQESYRVRVDQPAHGSVTVTPSIPENGQVKAGTILNVKVSVTDADWVFDSGYWLSQDKDMFYPTYKESMEQNFKVTVDNDMSIGASIMEASRLKGYRTVQDVVYATPGVKPLKYDMFIPDGAKNLPCIVIIHGGGWSSNDENIMRGLARELIKGGKYVVASIDYRWIGTRDGDSKANTMNQLIEDCYGAILHIREHAKEYGIDPDRIGVTGDSAGGHLSACMIDLVDLIGDGGFGIKEGVYEFKPTYMPKGMTVKQARNELTKAIKAAAPSYGVFDLQSLQRFVSDLDQKGKDAITPDSNIPQASKRKAPQFLVIGTQDRTVQRAPMEKYVENLKAAGQIAELLIVEGASHAFFDWKPDQGTKNTFARFGVPYAEKMQKFFDETL